jgi:bifunctional non-homologous end joining protein LigD
MALKEYRAKRNFSVTPEPQGAAKPRPRRTRELFFCVQKHLASHLHYDFRLEHDGVLLSWAVPKGPSLDPKVKRLAMKVEDHPIEYGNFEGVIPEGYGMGIVMLWDHGSWEPLVDDVDAALKKGDLKLRLNGVKLKGSWALIRTAGGDGRSWLLLKHRDEWAGALDIAVFAPLSVKSGGDLTDIAASEAPALWQSHRGSKSTSAGLMKIVEKAVALRTEREAQTAAGTPAEAGPNFSSAIKRQPAAGREKTVTTKAASTGRSTPRTRAATGRAARSPAARSRPRSPRS